jgi:hypothetical protein
MNSSRYILNSFDEAYKWKLIFTLLSLETVRPFWDEMELRIEKYAQLMKIAKGFVQQIKVVEQEIQSRDGEELLHIQKIYESTFERINQLSPQDALSLYKWGTQIFQYGTRLNSIMFIWSFLLRRLAELEGKSYILSPLLLTQSKIDYVKNVIVSNLGNFKNITRILQAQSKPLSEWDKEIFDNYGPSGSPKDWVEDTINFVKTKKVWQEIKEVLTEAELILLQKWGKEQAEIMKMPKDLAVLPNLDNDIV